MSPTNPMNKPVSTGTATRSKATQTTAAPPPAEYSPSCRCGALLGAARDPQTGRVLWWYCSECGFMAWRWEIRE